MGTRTFDALQEHPIRFWIGNIAVSTDGIQFDSLSRSLCCDQCWLITFSTIHQLQYYTEHFIKTNAARYLLGTDISHTTRYVTFTLLCKMT